MPTKKEETQEAPPERFENESSKHKHDGVEHEHKNGGPHIHDGVQDAEYLKRLKAKEAASK